MIGQEHQEMFEIIGLTERQAMNLMYIIMNGACNRLFLVEIKHDSTKYVEAKYGKLFQRWYLLLKILFIWSQIKRPAIRN